MVITFIVVFVYLAVWLFMGHLKMVDDLVDEIQPFKNKGIRLILGVLAIILSPSIFLFLVGLSGLVSLSEFFQELWEGEIRRKDDYKGC